MTEFKIVSSLEKIFPQSEGRFYEINRLSMLVGERSSFQLVVKTDEQVRFTVSGARTVEMSSYNVGFVPSKLPYYKDRDDDVIESPDGYFPDVLRPTENGEVELVNGGWCSVWFEMNAKAAGENSLVITLYNEENDEVGTAEIKVKVIDAVLPEQELICTHWFHCDCLATWYEAEAFGEEHWRIIENYMLTAAEHGMNMILLSLIHI